MVDNRAIGVGSGSALSFKSSDDTGIASKTNSQKYSSNEYIDVRGGQETEETFQEKPYVDQSAQLRAALASLAMINMPKVIKKKSFEENIKNEDDFDNEEKEYNEDDEGAEEKDTL